MKTATVIPGEALDQRKAIEEHVRCARLERIVADFDDALERYRTDKDASVAHANGLRAVALGHNLRDLLRPEIEALTAKIARVQR